jgi:uncharacterized protein YbaP (TraB family)
MPLLASMAFLAPGPAAATVEPACPPAATAPSPEELRAIGARAQDRGFLWRIEKNGRSSYLYGTLHIGRVEWLVPGERTRAALSGADVVAVEIDTTDPKILKEMQQSLGGGAKRPAYGTLRPRFEAQLRKACMPAALLESVSPEVLSSMLVVMSARHDGLDPAFGIDPVLASMGRALGKSVISLETPQMQAELLKRIHDPSPGSLNEVLRSLEQGQARPMLVRTADVWANSRYDELEDYARWCQCMRTPQEREQMKLLLDDRNPGLAQTVAELHERGQRVFAAVGSLHLFGPTGLPNLLRQRGFVVQPISLRPEPALAGHNAP